MGQWSRTLKALSVREVLVRMPGQVPLIGEVVRYENIFLLCYLRGPEGVIVALAEELS